MGYGPYGVIHYRERPVRIRVNSDVSPTRRETALVHELLHYAEELFKWTMRHVSLHRVAVQLYSRVLPRIIERPGSRVVDFDWVLAEVRSILDEMGALYQDEEARTLASFVIDEIAPTLRKYRLKGQ
jgi:hypothetical protein